MELRSNFGRGHHSFHGAIYEHAEIADFSSVFRASQCPCKACEAPLEHNPALFQPLSGLSKRLFGATIGSLHGPPDFTSVQDETRSRDTDRTDGPGDFSQTLQI